MDPTIASGSHDHGAEHRPAGGRAHARPRVPWWHQRSVADVRRSSRLSGEFILLSVLASAIATLGLITNSAAVIIGAMLIAPLLSPIMGIALGALGGRSHVLAQASITLGVGVVLSLGVAFVLASLALRLPFDVLATIPLEVESRTHPGPFDLAIALAGGAAAAYAVVRMEGAAALFGVAIATALVPPLCTVGIGLALGDYGIWTSSGTLFVTNAVAITAAATVVFTLLHLRPRRSRSGHSGIALAGGLVIALGFVLVPSAASLAQQSETAARNAQFADSVSQTVSNVLAARLPGSRLVDVQRTVEGSVLQLRVTAELVEAPSNAQVADIQTDVATRLGRTVHLVIVGLPVVEIDSVSTAAPSPLPEPTQTPTPTPAPTPTPTPAPTMHPPGPVTSTALFAPFVPRAVSAADAEHVALAGATTDGTAAVVATSGDGGNRWQVERLDAFPLATVSAAEHAAWATVSCPTDADPTCQPGMVTSTDLGTSWTMSSVPAADEISLLDALRGWVVTGNSVSGTTLLATTDGGVTWSQGPVSCPADAPVIAGVSLTSPVAGWLVCAGDAARPTAKALLATTDGGVTWTIRTATADVLSPASTTQLPADGSLRGITMRPTGIGWLWTDAALFRTSDNGGLWAAVALGDGVAGLVIESASLVDAQTGFVLAHDPAIGTVVLLRTGDGGASWESLGSWPDGVTAPPAAQPSSSPAFSAPPSSPPIPGGPSPSSDVVASAAAP